MLSTAIIVFRELLEISMILGVVLAATRHVPGRWAWIAGGMAAGCVGAGLVALFTETISNALSGSGAEVFNATILFTAAAFIGWTVVWMRGHAQQIAQHFKHVGHEVTEGKLPRYSLSLIIGLALLREGSEIVLFIYGMLLSGQGMVSVASGSVIGLVLGGAAGMMLYHGLLKIPARYALKVTSWLLVLLVAGLTSQAAGYLLSAGYFDKLDAQAWDSSWLLTENSILGQSLHGLIGYSAHPAVIQVLFYAGTLITLLLIIARIERTKKHAHVAVVAA